MKSAILSIFILLSLSVYAEMNPQQPQASVSFPVEKFTLKNGLTVLLHVNHQLPLISYHQWFRVGSRHEKPGRTGLAHFFEHLMFKGTEKMPSEKLEQTIQSNGGNNNAFTTRDYTGYYENFPSGKLEIAIQIESDRMRNLLFDMAKIQSEREVVKEERRYRYEDDVDGAIDELLNKTVYKVHPYKWPVIGYMADLNAATMDDMKEFYNTYYAPNNAVVVVAGDFDAAQAKSLIEKYYGAIPSQKIPDENIPSEPEQKAPRDAILKKDVQSPMMTLAYRAPKAGADDVYALDMLANILGAGASSRLHKRLVFRSQVVTEISAYNYTPKDPGVFEINATLKPNQSVANVLSAIKDEISKVKAADVSDAELVKAKNQVMMDYVRGLKTVDGRARALAINEILFGDYNVLFKDLDRYQKVTKDDIRRVANRYLATTSQSIVRVVPTKGAQL